MQEKNERLEGNESESGRKEKTNNVELSIGDVQVVTAAATAASEMFLHPPGRHCLSLSLSFYLAQV